MTEFNEGGAREHLEEMRRMVANGVSAIAAGGDHGKTWDAFEAVFKDFDLSACRHSGIKEALQVALARKKEIIVRRPNRDARWTKDACATVILDFFHATGLADVTKETVLSFLDHKQFPATKWEQSAQE